MNDIISLRIWLLLTLVLKKTLNSFNTKKQTTKFSSVNLEKNVKSELYHTENSKTRG